MPAMVAPGCDSAPVSVSPPPRRCGKIHVLYPQRRQWHGNLAPEALPRPLCDLPPQNQPQIEQLKKVLPLADNEAARVCGDQVRTLAESTDDLTGAI